MRDLLLVAFMLVMPVTAHAEDKQPATKIHEQITQQEGWLNTSRALTAEDLRGRIILLDFWTYCCVNCMQIMPDLAALEKEFGDKLTVIGVHSAKFKNEQDSENIRQAMIRHDLKHPVVNDYNFAIWKAFNVHAWPTLVLINPDGKIQQTYAGEGHKTQIAYDIKMLIANYQGQVNSSKLPMQLEKTKAAPHVLNFPTKMIYAPDFYDRKALLLADSGNHRIVVMTADGRIVDQVGTGKAGRHDGEFDLTQFNLPQGLAYSNPVLYVADTGNHLLRAVRFGMREVSSIAGTGKQGYEREAKDEMALRTPLSSPWDVALYPNSSNLVVAMAGSHQLWNYDTGKHTVSVIAGNGSESIEDGEYPYNSLSQPSALAADGDVLYFVDAETSSLRMLKDGKITTLIGKGLFDFGLKDGDKKTARMQHPLGLAAADGKVYIADSYNHAIRLYDVKSGKLTTLAGTGKRGHDNGALDKASFNEPNDVTLVEDKLFVSDTNNHAIRVIDLKAKNVSTLNVTDDQTLVDNFSDALPNLRELLPQQVTDKAPVKVVLDLAPGWKINKEAPSHLTLFDMRSGRSKAIGRFDRLKMLDNQLVLPKMDKGNYRLQGSLYYCEEKAGSQCLLESFDVMIEAGKSEAMQMTLPLR